MMRTIGLVVVGMVGLGGGACAPNTIIRRTALINAPQAPTREGQPLARGDVRIEGHVSSNTADEGSFFLFEPGVAEVGDPGVLIPDLQLGASVWGGLPWGIEFGAQVYYASMQWADPNVFGVLPFPRGQEEDLLMGGVGMRFNIKVGDPRLAFGILTEVNIASIPEAIFVCTDVERCSNDRLTFEGEELYTFDRIERETFFLPNLALQLGWRFGDVPGVDELDASGQPMAPDPGAVRMSVMPFLHLGLQASVTNTGFEPDITTLPEDSLEALWVGYLGFGVDALIDKLVLGASMLIPLEGEEAIDFGVVFSFRLGAQL